MPIRTPQTLKIDDLLICRLEHHPIGSPRRARVIETCSTAFRIEWLDYPAADETINFRNTQKLETLTLKGS